jgi:hypothetical protein
MVPALVPRVVRTGDITELSFDWAHHPVILTTEVMRSLRSICAKYNVHSCLIGQTRISIRLNTETSGVVRERIDQILGDRSSWKHVVHRPRFPSELIECSGNGDGREWDYTEQLTDTEFEYAE